MLFCYLGQTCRFKMEVLDVLNVFLFIVGLITFRSVCHDLWPKRWRMVWCGLLTASKIAWCCKIVRMAQVWYGMIWYHQSK